jgi:hypothetical protein
MKPCDYGFEMKTLALGVLAALLVPSAASAASFADDAASYCRFVGYVTRSTTALQLSPQIFLDYGLVNGATPNSGGMAVNASQPAQRLTIGLRYSLTGLVQGITDRYRADAECERYHATSALARFLVENREQVSPASLDAKLAVLRGAAPRAREVVSATRALVEKSRATVEELNAVEVRLTDLESSIVEAEGLRAGLVGRTVLPPPETLLHNGMVAVDRVERYEARLRELLAFDLSVRGGFDQIYGATGDYTPVFGVVSLSFNPAVFYQTYADAQARQARVRWAGAETEGIGQKVELLANRLRATLAGERRRLHETTVLLADVEARLRALDGLEFERLRRVRDGMWFDWVKLKADHEFLQVHVAELGRSLGEGAP